MSLWARVNQLPMQDLDQIRFIYGKQFPIEVRHYLAEWIEDRLLNPPIYPNDQENDMYEQEAAIFLNDLINELERTVVNLPDESLSMKIQLHRMARNFHHLFEHNPTQLYQHLINCLHRECQYVALQERWVILQDSEVTEVFKALQHLQSMVRINQKVQSNLMKDYEHLQLAVYELQQNRVHLDTMEDTELRVLAQNQHTQHQKTVNDQRQICTGKRLALVDSFRKTILLTGEAQSKVLNQYLPQWKLHQWIAGNGGPQTLSVPNLDTIQVWCENLAEIIWSTMEQIRFAIQSKWELDVEQGDVPDPLRKAMNDMTTLLQTLIPNTFIIENQPPQVIKTNTRFSASVRLLVGNTLNIKTANVQVKASIISEEQVQQTQLTNKPSEESCGEIMHNIGYLVYTETSKKLSAIFGMMQLQKIKRADRQRCFEYVTDRKFALLFQSTLSVCHDDLVFSVWTISLPVVVIVNGCQEAQSWATITWENTFAAMNRVPFQVLDKVYWNVLSGMLNEKFLAMTGSSLTAEHMHYLSEKVFKKPLPSPVPYDLTITWSQFCKEPIPERSFTFWDWFYAAMKVTRKHLRGPWMAGCIIGFIRKSKAEEYLLKCPRGTFLLRFSDSELGGITIAWMSEGTNGRPQVLHIQPFTPKDLSTRSLSDRIHDLDDLVFLYPNKPKHQAFDQFTTPKKPPRNKNYDATEVRTVIMPVSNNIQMNSSPSTPSYAIQSLNTSQYTLPHGLALKPASDYELENKDIYFSK